MQQSIIETFLMNSRFSLKQIDQELEKISQLGAGLPEQWKKALKYIETKYLSIWNKSLHKPLESTFSIRKAAQQVEKMKSLVEGEQLDGPGAYLKAASKLRKLKQATDSALLNRPFKDGYIIKPPKIKGEYYEVSYTADQSAPITREFYEFDQGWEKLWGRPAKGFSALVFANPKEGKSTLILDFSAYLARTKRGPILYASLEEADNPTFEERKNRLDAAEPNITIKNYLPVDLSGFKVVVIDSITKGDLDIETMTYLLQNYKDITFIFISQVTKEGKAKGSNEIPHEVDMIITIEDGVASGKSRYGAGEMEVRYE